MRIDQGGPDWAAKGSWRPVRTWRRSTLGGASFTHTGSGRATYDWRRVTLAYWKSVTLEGAGRA
jgi:hypothetical protein